MVDRSQYPICAAPGCGRRARAKTLNGGPGMCSTHESRLRRYGNTSDESVTLFMGIYADKGCQYSPSCLRCPLPVCKEDMTLSELRVMEARMRRTG